MPKRTDISSILIIGAGPIVIGQACEFDYSGTQACKALKAEGYRIVLVNSNPATIMTDPDLADATYIEPITPEIVAKIIEKERYVVPGGFALLPTMGGQTALNTALSLNKMGVLARLDVEMIGATAQAIDKAEDRELFREAMQRIGLETPRSLQVKTLIHALEALDEIGLPAIIRPSFTLGGTGGGIAYNQAEFIDIVERGIDASPTNEVLIEESVLGWKEFEIEVVRDKRDNCIIICSIENIDPMGVHTGDSITIAPALTLTDKEYQIMRDASIAVLREIGVETGGSNVQFAVNPADGRLVIIEMNPRVSRSSALASKATGFPIAKVAARLAVGYTLDEIANDITGGATPASFEPTIDYVVTKIPRFAFEKFPGAEPILTTSMKSVGEAMAIGRTFQESLQKALRSLETGFTGLDEIAIEGLGQGDDKNAVRAALGTPTPDRLLKVAQAMRLGFSDQDIHASCKIDPWFLAQIRELVETEAEIAAKGLPATAGALRRLKAMGFSDARLAKLTGMAAEAVTRTRRALGVRPVFKRIDSCAAEFASPTAYMYSTYEAPFAGPPVCEAAPSDRNKVVILGGGPNRIGQGIEFDYCCCHASFALKEAGYETIMINCNPETVSTDYDTSDRLYFEPLTAEDVLEIIETERSNGRLHGVIVQFGGQTPLKLAAAAGTGRNPDPRHLARHDRSRRGPRPFQEAARQAQAAPAHQRHRHQPERGARDRRGDRLSDRDPALLRARRTRHGDRPRRRPARPLHRAARQRSRPPFRARGLGEAPAADRPLSLRRHRSRRRLPRRRQGHDHRRHHGAHRGSRHPFRRQRLRAAAAFARPRHARRARAPDARARARARGRRPDERAIRHQGRRHLRARGQSAGLAHGAVRRQGDRRSGGQDRGPDHGRRDARELRAEAARLEHIGVKEAVFPFARFPGVDTVLGPEMKSTGEVMGIDRNFAIAFAKSQIGGGSRLPRAGTVFVSVRDADKPRVLEAVRLLVALGFRIIATSGTQRYLAEQGLPASKINKVAEGRPHIVDAIKNGEVQLVFNTTEGATALADSRSLRRAALLHKVPYYTTLSGAVAAAQGIKAYLGGDLEVRALQSYFGGKAASGKPGPAA